MQECFACKYDIPYACRDYQGQKRVLDTPELWLQMILSPHMGAENQNQVACKSNRCS